MLAVVTAPGARFDAGSMGLALARRWSDSGERVLFVDADPSGARLAERLGAAEHAEYSPAERGLPSLIVSREPLTLRLLADHCYSLDTAAGSLWALFAPRHRAGAEHAARWLGERAADLAAVDARRGVVVSSSLPAGAETLAPVLWASTVLVVVAPVEAVEDAKELWRLCRELKLSGLRCRHRVLIVEGDPAVDDDDIAMEAGMHMAGRLPAVDDDRVLRSSGGRRERAFTTTVDRIAARLLAFSQLIIADSSTAEAAATPAATSAATADLRQLARPQPEAAVNGARNGPPLTAGQVPEAQADQRR